MGDDWPGHTLIHFNTQAKLADHSSQCPALRHDEGTGCQLDWPSSVLRAVTGPCTACPGVVHTAGRGFKTHNHCSCRPPNVKDRLSVWSVDFKDRLSVQFKRWYLCARKSPYALYPIAQKFQQRRLLSGSNVRLTDDGPLLSFQRRSSSASSFRASLLQAIDGVTSLALFPQVVSSSSTP